MSDDTYPVKCDITELKRSIYNDQRSRIVELLDQYEPDALDNVLGIMIEDMENDGELIRIDGDLHWPAE